MEMKVNLPENTALTPKKIQEIDTLLSLFEPNELQKFYAKQQHTMQLTTNEDVELKDAIGNLLRLLN
jgi:hypothetical protein